MTITTATLAELPLLAAIEACQHYPWSDAQLASCFADGYRVRLLWYGQQAIGFTVCQRVLDESTLFNICVSPAFRGQGLGQQLLADCIAEAQQQADQALFLEVRASNQAATALYQRAGFATVGHRRAYYPTVDGREDALVMRLALNGV